jgi:hypothetical protein
VKEIGEMRQIFINVPCIYNCPKGDPMHRRIQKETVQTMLTSTLGSLNGMKEARLLRDLQNRKEIERFKSQISSEGPQSLRKLITVVMLKGADSESVKGTVEKLGKSYPDLNFRILPEPAEDFELPADTAVLVFVANGSTHGVDSLLEKTSERRSMERIATVLVSEHKDETDRFDHKMHFDRAIKENKLVSALNAALYYRRGELLSTA